MKTYLTASPVLLIATPTFAHHQNVELGASGLLQNPIGYVALAGLFLASALLARRLSAVQNGKDT